MNTILGRGLAAATAALLAACSALSRDGARPSAHDVGTPLAVHNTNWRDMTLFAVRAGTRTRLGTVTALGRADFVVPSTLMPTGEVRLLVSPIDGSAPLLTDPISVAPGQAIELTIGSRLPLTSWSVR
jgi:hypothetical protein